MARRSESSDNGNIHQIVNEFVQRLVATVEAATTSRIQAAVASALGTPVRRGPGRPPRNPFAVQSSFSAAPRASRPKQLCPVPGCKNPAAPVFGMVCSEHKDVPKAKIKQFREARRNAQAGGAKTSGQRANRGRKPNRAGRGAKRAATASQAAAA